MERVHVDPASVFCEYVDLPSPGEPLDPKAIPTHGGVYCVTGDGGVIIQTLSAQNLRRSATARLQPIDPETQPRRADLRAIARRLWWQPAYSVFESNLLYLDISRRITPDAYRKHLAFLPAWFATIEPGDRLPRWRPANVAFQPGAAEFGPFERRRQCIDFITLLEDLFDLCREHHILDQTPHGIACTYHEMGRCPAPCDGTIPLEKYRATIRASVRFASGHTTERLDELEMVMRNAAAARDYTLAARIKETVDGARDFLRHHESMGAPVNQFRLLVIQRGERRSRVKPFFVDRGLIQPGDSVCISDVPTAADAWIARLHRPGAVESVDPVHRSECVWLVSHFLAKRDSAPGVFLRMCDVRTADNLIDAVHRTFGTGKKCASDKQPESKRIVDRQGESN